jgi:hypothetical protein
MNRHELLIYLSVLAGVGSIGLAEACSSLSPYPGEDPTGVYEAGYQIGTTGGGPTPTDGGVLGDGEVVGDGDLGDGAVPVCTGCTVLAMGVNPQSLTLDPTNVYFPTEGTGAGTGAVMSVPRLGGTTTPIASGLTGPLDVKYANSWLGWSAFSGTGLGQSSVSLVAIPATTPTTPGATQNSAYGVALDSANLYWVSTDTTGDVLVQASPLTGGGLTTLGMTTGGTYEPFDMAVTTSWIYFAAYIPGGGGGLFQLAVTGGGSPSEVWTGSSMSEPRGVAVDPSMTNVYWTDYGVGSVYSMPVGGGTVTTLASGITNPFEIAVDSTNAYFTAVTGVYVVPLGSTTATLLVSTDSPLGVAADDSDGNVYFANGGQVISHAK